MNGSRPKSPPTELINGFVTEMRRRASVDADFALTVPNPGASEADLEAAEHRLGHRLDPDHRALLQVADGWGGSCSIPPAEHHQAALDHHRESGASSGAVFGFEARRTKVPLKREDRTPVWSPQPSNRLVNTRTVSPRPQ